MNSQLTVIQALNCEIYWVNVLAFDNRMSHYSGQSYVSLQWSHWHMYTATHRKCSITVCALLQYYNARISFRCVPQITEPPVFYQNCTACSADWSCVDVGLTWLLAVSQNDYTHYSYKLADIIAAPSFTQPPPRRYRTSNEHKHLSLATCGVVKAIDCGEGNRRRWHDFSN